VGILQYNVQAIYRLDKTNVLDNIVMLEHVLAGVQMWLSGLLSLCKSNEAEVVLTCRFFNRSISACVEPVSATRIVILSGGLMAHLDHAQLALGQVHKLDLLDCNGLARTPMDGLVDGTKGTLA
jgi:hypothetical protein